MIGTYNSNKAEIVSLGGECVVVCGNTRMSEILVRGDAVNQGI